MTSSRETVLARVRAALADVPGGEPPAWELPSPREGPAPADAARFAERAAEYRATVTRVPEDGQAIAGALADACARHGARRVVVPEGFPEAWLPDGLELLRDRPEDRLTVGTLAAADAVVTTCAAAIEDTGTVVLDAGAGQGRRVLSLLPDLHLCVVRADAVVRGVADAVASLQRTAATTRPVTFVSGPSATSDIELRRVEGVHGPRRLEIVVAG